jgi:NitT/TauT family transport system ATP-binding protein
MIELAEVTFAYKNAVSRRGALPGGAPIFERFSWRAEAGQSWAVIGPSGCGKTTLLYLIGGLYAPQSGRITVAGEQVPRKDRGRTGLILQDYGLLPWATVEQNVDLGLRIRQFYGLGRVDQEARARVDFWLGRLGLDGLRRKYPNQISGGQRQRTAIARTLVVQPDILLMDEPFSSLDALTREDLQQVALELYHETKITMVVVTHSIEEAVLLGRQILVLGLPPSHREGKPPGYTEGPQVIDNPHAGELAYRQDPGFYAQCQRLRERLAS